MANILLLNPVYRGKSRNNNLPHGLLAVAAVLIKKGHCIQILDFSTKNYKHGEEPDRAFQSITNLNFDVVGISGISTSYYFWKKFIQSFRKKYGNTIPVIAGGSVASTMPEVFLKYVGVDAICTGDAEPVVNELVDCLLQNKSLDNVDGIGYRNSKSCIIKPGARVKDMDSEVPIPPYDLINIDLYRHKYQGRTREFVMFSSRGCPFNCSFCSRNFGRYFTQHSVDKFIGHMAFVAEKYSPDLFCFADELFTANRKWITEFCAKYKKSKIRLPFRISVRADTVDKELITMMKDANCCEINFGIESGSPTILKEMRKKISAEQNLRALLMTNEVGLFNSVNIVLGMPSETDETIKETKSMLIEADVKKFGAFFVTAYPGSELFEYAVSKGFIKNIDNYMLTVGNANIPYINYTGFDDNILEEKMRELIRDVEYAWHKKRGIYYLLKYKLRHFKKGFNILREQGINVFIGKVIMKIKSKIKYK